MWSWYTEIIQLLIVPFNNTEYSLSSFVLILPKSSIVSLHDGHERLIIFIKIPLKRRDFQTKKKYNFCLPSRVMNMWPYRPVLCVIARGFIA